MHKPTPRAAQGTSEKDHREADIRDKRPPPDPGSTGSRRVPALSTACQTSQANDGLVCRKTRRRVDGRDPRCPAPDQPCKFRSECVIYAMQEDNERSRAKEPHWGEDAGTGSRGPVDGTT